MCHTGCPVPRGVRISVPSTGRVRTDLLGVALEESRRWSEPRAPLQLGPALSAPPTVLWVQSQSRHPLMGLPLQMSWVCWWPVAVRESWPGLWPPPWM